MLVDLENATTIANSSYPQGIIQSVVDYRGVWLFKIFTDDPDEGIWDPFFSVDQKTGVFSEFSPMDDGNIFEINALFMAAEKTN